MFYYPKFVHYFLGNGQTQARSSKMKKRKNTDKSEITGIHTLCEGINSTENKTYKELNMKINFFHVRIYFCRIIQIKRKKIEFYLFAIYVFVYLCAVFNSVT